MKALALNIFLLLSLFCIGQENVRVYLCRFNTSATYLDYKLLLGENNTFFLHGYGSQLDAIYPNEVYYGNYSDSNDSLRFSFTSPDSILIETNQGWENKFLFCKDTIYIWDKINKKNVFEYSTCIKYADKIEFKNTDLRGRIFFLTNTLQKKYTFSLKGSLPELFKDYVKSLQFSLNEINDDIRVAHFSDIISSMSITRGISNSNKSDSIDMFSLLLVDYISESNLFFYTYKLYNKFKPLKIHLDSLSTDSINIITLKITDKHDIEWRYLNENHYQQNPKVKSKCLVRGKNGQVINISKEQQKLRKKIIEKDITYEDAYRFLLNSRYFANKKIGRALIDSLPSESDIIFNLSFSFSVNTLERIYRSFYNISDSVFDCKRIDRWFSQNKSEIKLYVSKAGFNENKTICFLPIKRIEDNKWKKETLIFERRINKFVLTGKIIDGKYSDMIEFDECEYYPDMRNYKLFY